MPWSHPRGLPDGSLEGGSANLGGGRWMNMEKSEPGLGMLGVSDNSSLMQER